MRRDKSNRRQGNRRSKGRKFKRAMDIFLLLISITAFVTSGLFAEDRVAEGAKEIAKGVAAAPKKVADTANETNILYGITAGLGEGLLDAAKGIGEGIFKILTFYSKNE